MQTELLVVSWKHESWCKFAPRNRKKEKNMQIRLLLMTENNFPKTCINGCLTAFPLLLNNRHLLIDLNNTVIEKPVFYAISRYLETSNLVVGTFHTLTYCGFYCYEISTPIFYGYNRRIQ